MHEERVTFGLEGLLPASVSTVEGQERRVCDNIARKTDPLEKYIGPAALLDRNDYDWVTEPHTRVGIQFGLDVRLTGRLWRSGTGRYEPLKGEAQALVQGFAGLRYQPKGVR